MLDIALCVYRTEPLPTPNPVVVVVEAPGMQTNLAPFAAAGNAAGINAQNSSGSNKFARQNKRKKEGKGGEL